MKKNAKNTMLCWNPSDMQPRREQKERGAVALVPWPDHRSLSDQYVMSGLAAYRNIQTGSFEHRKLMIFITAVQAIVRDGCDPMAVHNALLGLEEYRDGLADDMPGVVELRKRFGED